MKISLNRVKALAEHCGAGDVSAQGVDTLVSKIGAQLGGVDEVIDLGVKYQNIIIAKVVSCETHPNADRLHVCKLDDGGKAEGVERDENGHVQVVCGAPNVREGLLVAWLPPGATVPETVDKDPFVLSARELRGVVSNGMLASPKELALGDSHDGILELGDDVQPGQDFAEVYGLKDDVVIDIENKMFTHRPDCFGFLGVARELAGIQSLPFKSPDWYQPNVTLPSVEADQLPLTVRNEIPELAPRFTAVTMRDVEVKPSPVWLQVELAKVGSRAINNIVDYTNYFMLLSGQPLHAYDYDKVKALSNGDTATIVVRNPQPGEKIMLLNGKEIEPRTEAIMIATDKQAIGIGGVMGGADTEVDANTKHIIIESANFDMYSIRRTAMAHGLFTDAVTRFNKGQSPQQCLPVLARIVDEIRSYAAGKIASELVDDRHFDAAPKPVKVSPKFINDRLGLTLSAQDMQKLLENVEFTVTTEGDELVTVAPFWRTDIELKEDIVEEVGRLYGYDKLPLKLPVQDITPTKKSDVFELKAHIRDRLSRAGANEVLTYSFVHGDLLKKTGQELAKAFQVANALSPDLQYYRLSLMPSLLDKIHPNIKAGYDEFALFELGKTHNLDHLDEDGLPLEFSITALVVAASSKLKKAGAPYYEAQKYLQELVGVELNFKPLSQSQDMMSYPVVQPYEPNRSALVSIRETDTFLGIIGEFKPSVARSLKLPSYTAGFEVDTAVLQELLLKPKPYTVLPRFPSVSQDITLKVAADLRFQELDGFIWQQLSKTKPANVRVTLSPLDIYQKADDTQHKQVSLRLEIASYDRTLTDAEVNKLLDAAAAAANQAFNAERI